MKKEDYAALYTLRKDGRYQGYYRDVAGKRHVICDRDPAELYRRLLERSGAPVKEDPSVRLFSSVASRWEREHREEIEPATWKNYAPHYDTMVSLCPSGDRRYLRRGYQCPPSPTQGEGVFPHGRELRPLALSHDL